MNRPLLCRWRRHRWNLALRRVGDVVLCERGCGATARAQASPAIWLVTEGSGDTWILDGRNGRTFRGAPEIIAIVDGTERPAWALRAGQIIVRTEWEHAEGRLTLWIESPDDAQAAREQQVWSRHNFGARHRG